MRNNSYQEDREKWIHEDNLVNNRLTWLILSQTILFAGYGILITRNIKDTHIFDLLSVIIYPPSKQTQNQRTP